MENDQPADVDERWLAYELHDGLLQWLVSARMHVDTSLLRLEQLDRTLTRESLSVTLGYIESALEEGRELIGFLESKTHGTTIDLAPLLQAFIEKVEFEAEQNQQEIVASSVGAAWPSLKPRQVWNVLRIAQQAVRNAIQHAGPCRIQVCRGWFDERHIQLEIRDSGRGFEVLSASAQTGHFGLASLQHRAKLIGASLFIDSHISSGTSILLKLPTAMQRIPTE